MTLKQFNDAFLREGEMPIEMMRAALDGKAADAQLQRELEVLRRGRAGETVGRRRVEQEIRRSGGSLA